MNRSKYGGVCGTGIYMREETASRMMAANRPYGVFCDFYSVSPEYIVCALVLNCPTQVLFGVWTPHMM
jgi:hypothetical protein